MMARRAFLTIVICLLAATLVSRAARADLRASIELLTKGAADRSAGSEGAAKNADDLARQLGAITGVPVRRQGFLLALPMVEKCAAVDRTAGAENAGVPLWPLLPSGGQAASLPPEHATADLLYVKDGTLAALRGKDLRGRFVAMEMTSGQLAWQTSASLGARAIVFLGDDKSTIHSFLEKATHLPVGIPRFYCDDAAAVAKIRAGTVKSLAIDVAVRWREKRLENLFCFLPGHFSPGQFVIVQARYDASSQVMGRAPGATQAAGAAALLDLAERLRTTPEHPPILFLLTAGDEWNGRGTRAALDLISPAYKTVGDAAVELRKRSDDVGNRLKASLLISAGIRKIAGGDLRPLNDPETRTALEDQLLRESSRVEEKLQRARLASPRDPKLLAELQSEKEDAIAAIGGLAPDKSRTATQEARLKSAAGTLLPRWQTEVDRLVEQRNILAAWPTIRADIGDRTPMLFLSLALTSGSPRFGFFARSAYANNLDFTGKAFAQSFRRYAINTSAFVPESTEKRFTLESFFPLDLGFSSDYALARGIPGGAFATVQDRCDFLDTPNDTAERLNYFNLNQQQRGLLELLARIGPNPTLRGALTDPLFYVRNELGSLTADQPVTLFERTVGESLPRLTAANCLIGGEAELENRPLGKPLAGTRRQDWHVTHADGSALFTSEFRFGRMRLHAFDFDAAGQPIRTLAGNQADVRGLAADFTPDPDRPVRCMLFDSRRLDCYGLFDPRYLDTLDKIEVLDARRLDKAQYSNVYADEGTAVVFMPPEIQWQLLVAKGTVNNRMLLINADETHPSGRGFDTTDLAALGPLAWRNARDLAALNGKRQRDLEKFGISSEVVKELQAAATRQIAAAEAAEKIRDYPAMFAATDAAWSLHSQIYQTLIDTSNGIIKGVIFLLLGIIPFAYFLERLLIGSANVYRQIAGFAAIFAIMTLALWFHPAFRISSAPLMILLAFLILILSSAVVYILWGKFEEEISRIRGSGARGAAHSTSLRRGAVLGAAVRLGLSNMRRRGARTALTLLTLVLLTFTLLCFTSVTEYVQVRPKVVAFPADLPVPPAGILLRQREWKTLPQQSIDLAKNLSPGAVTATRWWYASGKSEEPWLLPIRRPNRPAEASFYASALVGLEPSEAQFQSAALPTLLPEFSQLAGQNLCWLPAEAKKSAPFALGDTVDILGYRLTIAGFFDDDSFRQLRQLTGDPLSPVDPSGAPRTPVNANDPRQSTPETTYRFLSAGNTVIVPATLVEKLGGRLTSIMIRPADTKTLFTQAEDLARRSAFTVYVSDGQQVRSINAALGSEPKDFGTVLIPMLIAGVIILNTMLGAVAERTREIHVYTSIGLAPAHVGMLFLAEAAALGTIGVVSGYIFGQGLATLLSYTHLLPGVDLNYSSLSAIVTMGLVLGLVMISALWPARSASRVAAPSLDRRWKLPKPIGDVLYVDLPFTVNETAAKGVVAFIEEFLLTTTQTGGRFTADAIKPFSQTGIDNLPIRGLTARIWLAPYDLGVIQSIRLAIHPTPEQNIFDVHLELTREAGNPATWQRLNHPFLVEIRKQFLLWRNLPAEQVANYVERSESHFKTT